MNSSDTYDIAVVGCGGAGQMAVLRAVLNRLKTCVFMGDIETTRRSRETWVTEVDNMPGYFHKERPVTTSTEETIAFLQSKKELTDYLTVVKAKAASIKKIDDVFVISAGAGSFKAKFVVLCTGTMDIQPKIGESIEPVFAYANRGDILYCIRCDGHKAIGHKTAVIGHGSGAGWIAVMLKERYDPPALAVLTNGEAFDASEEVRTLLERYKISVDTDPIDKILGDASSGLEGFDAGGKKVEATRAFVALGSIVYNELAKELGVKLSDRDHIVTDERGRTSIEGVYAAGDLVEGKKKQVYTAWDMAVDAVDDIDERIRLSRRHL